ncbi:hypothetical protein P7K49_005706, partial [Saguinus oedipus]
KKSAPAVAGAQQDVVQDTSPTPPLTQTVKSMGPPPGTPVEATAAVSEEGLTQNLGSCQTTLKP